MELAPFIRQMPKVELHVHLEGSVRPATLLKLARRHHISLPADNLAGLRRHLRLVARDRGPAGFERRQRHPAVAGKAEGDAG